MIWTPSWLESCGHARYFEDVALHMLKVQSFSRLIIWVFLDGGGFRSQDSVHQGQRNLYFPPKPSG